MFLIFKIYFKMQFIPVIKAEFSASLLQSSVSHDVQKSFKYSDLLLKIHLLLLLLCIMKTAE